MKPKKLSYHSRINPLNLAKCALYFIEQNTTENPTIPDSPSELISMCIDLIANNVSTIGPTEQQEALLIIRNLGKVEKNISGMQFTLPERQQTLEELALRAAEELEG